MPDKYVQNLINSIPELSSYKFKNKVNAPHWLRDQANQGMDRAAKVASISLKGSDLFDKYMENNRTHDSAVNAGGVGGGFQKQAKDKAELGYLKGVNEITADVEKQSNDMKLQALSQMLSLDQFNTNAEMTYQQMMSSNDFAIANMKMQEHLTNKSIKASNKLAKRQSLMSLANNLAGVGAAVASGGF